MKMKKIIFWILSILLISPVFANDSVSPVVYSASWDRLYINYWYNYYSTYYADSSVRCWKWQFFWLGIYSDYYNWIFNFSWVTDNNLTYWNSSIYLLWLNNWYFLSNSPVVSLNFIGSVYRDWLACNSRAYPGFVNNSHFVIGFDSSNNLHNITYLPDFWYSFNYYEGINSSMVLLYNTDSLLTNSFTSTWFNDFIYIDKNRNQYFMFDNLKLYSKYWSAVDIPDWYIRKKFYIGWDFSYSTVYWNSSEYNFYSVVDSWIIAVWWDFSVFSVSPNYWYFLFHIVDYSNWYYSANSSTFILSKTDSWIIYNAYNVFSNNVSELLSLTPIRKWYFNWDFNSFVNSDWQYFEVYWSYTNWVTFRVYSFNSSNEFSNYSFSFIEDSSVPVINLNWESVSNTPEDLQLLYCQQNPTSPYCNWIYTWSRDEVRCWINNSWVVNCYFTDYSRPTNSSDCPYIESWLDNWQVYIQYRSTWENRCVQWVSVSVSDSTPQEDLTSELTWLENNINLAFSGIVWENFKFYSCPFNSPFKAFHLSSIGWLSSFLLDKFFDVNLVGPFNCLLWGILYSETDSVSLWSRLLSDSYHWEKFLNNFPDDVKKTINWLLFAGMVLFFWSFRPKDH